MGDRDRRHRDGLRFNCHMDPSIKYSIVRSRASTAPKHEPEILSPPPMAPRIPNIAVAATPNLRQDHRPGFCAGEFQKHVVQ